MSCSHRVSTPSSSSTCSSESDLILLPSTSSSMLSHSQSPPPKPWGCGTSRYARARRLRRQATPSPSPPSLTDSFACLSLADAESVDACSDVSGEVVLVQRRARRGVQESESEEDEEDEDDWASFATASERFATLLRRSPSPVPSLEATHAKLALLQTLITLFRLIPSPNAPLPQSITACKRLIKSTLYINAGDCARFLDAGAGVDKVPLPRVYGSKAALRKDLQRGSGGGRGRRVSREKVKGWGLDVLLVSL